jgi:hypothetical protein
VLACQEAASTRSTSPLHAMAESTRSRSSLARPLATAATARSVWYKPVSLSMLVVPACLAVTYYLDKGWTTYGTDFSDYTILLDVRSVA